MRIRALAPDFCIGTAGTIKTIAKNATTIDDIDALLDEWCTMTAAQRIEHCDVDELHAPTIIAGTLVLRELMDALQFTEFTPCPAALREGILTAAAASREDELPVRQRGVLALAERTGCDPLHGAHVARLATRLFDQTARLHNLGAHARELLAHAALLHESGMQISHRRPQRHTRYIVRNAELDGFDDDEIGVIAEVAGHHRKSPPHHDAPDVVAHLSAILRVAEALDRGHRQCVDDAHVTFGFGRLHVNLATNADATAELALASKRARYFAKLFEREVSFAATVNASGVSSSP